MTDTTNTTPRRTRKPAQPKPEVKTEETPKTNVRKLPNGMTIIYN